MLISFVKGHPALVINKEKALVVGDLHIGLNLKFRERGLHFQNATNRLAEKLLKAYEASNAKSIVILGDIKESITSPSFGEYKEIKTFFDAMRGIDIKVVKGNHDGGIENVLKNVGFESNVSKEFIIGGVALTHGNTWPSEEAMNSRYLVIGHGHFAVRRDSGIEKIWFTAPVSKGAKKRYEKYNKREKLVVVPPFNELIMGSTLDSEAKNHLLVLKNDVFSFKQGEAYDLQKKRIGSVLEIIRQG
jgi:putative SbcD/Mre11-related phosphoesterase